MTPLTETSLPFPLLRRGKVRDVYELGDHLLFVASDRISAFDVVLAPGIAGKGIVLTQISNFWFRLIREVENHLVETEFARFPEEVRKFPELKGRSVMVRRCEVIPIECVARGYLAGSGLNEYLERGTVCSLPLPPGLMVASKLPATIFTPATKASTGHDENISFAGMAEIVGLDVAEKLRKLTISIYDRAANFAETRGIIIADTKFEFGLFGDTILWIDEALTPDSSRFWPADQYRPGVNPPSFDKQFVRDWLESTGWNKTPPAPGLPPGVVEVTLEKYLSAYERLTGKRLDLAGFYRESEP